MTMQTTDNPILTQATAVSNQTKTIDTTIQTPAPVKSKSVGMLPIIGVAALVTIVVVALGLYLKNRKQSSVSASPNQTTKNDPKLPLDSPTTSTSTTKTLADSTRVSDQSSALETDSKMPTSSTSMGEQTISAKPSESSNPQTNQDSASSSTSSVVKEASLSDHSPTSDQELTG